MLAQAAPAEIDVAAIQAALVADGIAIARVARVDAGTIEPVRKTGGVEVVCSGDLVQRFAAVWNHRYLPTASAHRAIGPDQLVLFDLWGKTEQPGAVFADVTWMEFTGAALRERDRPAFAAVAAATDAAANLLQKPDSAEQELRGCRVDCAASTVLRQAGYPDRILHSLGETVHGKGVNVDDYETRDDRRLLPGAGFTIEPGMYFDDFGVRSEINMIVQAREAIVTGPSQQEIVAIV